MHYHNVVKKLSILLIIVSLCLTGWGLIKSQAVVMILQTGTTTTAPACDTCSGNLVFTSHFENSDDITSGNPCGCTTGGDETWALSGTTYSATQKTDGSYSLYYNDSADTSLITHSGFDASVGSLVFDFYEVTEAQYDCMVWLEQNSSGDHATVYINGGTLVSYYNGASYAACNCGSGAWKTITFKWRTADVNPNTFVSCDTNNSNNSNPTDITGNFDEIKGPLANDADDGEYYIDNVWIYDTWIYNDECTGVDTPYQCCTGVDTGTCGADS
ncbi:MAG: hypothetical protein ACXAD7_28090 [Candidatus Kariarchaeaceae archaeon]